MSNRLSDIANVRTSSKIFLPRTTAAVALLSLVALSACESGGTSQGTDKASPFAFLRAKDNTSSTGTSTKLVERDVEAPDAFQVTEAGLWDGRPSIGGVWVAHPDVGEPERVIIRNNSNGKFVIGALFRRERALPGPRLQASSDAAAALGMLAGAPVELNVTALRREAVAPEPTVDTAPDDILVGDLDAPIDVATTALDAPTLQTDPIASAAAAIEAPTAPVAAPIARATTLDKPFIQIGIFSVEDNAKRTADQMRNSGIIPTIYEQSSNGKPFWRVVVGPAQSKSERSQLLKTVKAAGFSDAYAVTN